MKVLAALGLSSYLFSLSSALCPHETQGIAAWDDPDTWEDGLIPNEDSLVEISSAILINGETDRLGGVTIVDGGRLIFDPTVPLAKLTSKNVLIEDGGSLEIGSKECMFEGQAEIVLTGKRDDVADETTYGFGQKFIGVAPGGSLEIHGASASKVSWTRLAKPLKPKAKKFATDVAGQPENSMGFAIYGFNSYGVLKSQVNAEDLPSLQSALSGLVGQIVVFAKQVPFSVSTFNHDMAAMQSEIESSMGITAGDLHLATLVERTDPYLLVVNKADPGNFLEDMDSQVDNNDPDGRITDLLQMELNGFVFRAQVFQKTTSAPWLGKREVFVETYPNDYYSHEVIVKDTTGWQAGDRIVVASTDFDFEQAEEFEITSVNGTTLTVDGHISYLHYASTYKSIDMRAEVGLLTRNIKIHGEMEAECYTDLNKCDKYDFDNFGGHTKAVEGFASYNIEGAELFHMGQMTVLGSYPIHFHMADDTRRNGERTAVQHNSIHNTFSRCVTVHGSHNVDVINNVAHDHYGHCYFLEDGGEKGTYFEGNLGLTTRQGELTPSDEQPSTFWITSPLTTLINNAAAGSDTKHGVGIWYLYPDVPVGPSATLELFGYRQAKHTPFGPFKNNVAHSNGDIGLAFFNRLGEDHEIIGCSTTSPRVDPLDTESELSPLLFDGLTAYKNRKINAVIRVEAAEVLNFKLADSMVGVNLFRNMLSGYQRIKKSVIVGESPNIGVPQNMKVLSDDGSEIWVSSDRSVAWPWGTNHNLIGVNIDAEGPSHLDNVKFFGFKHTEHRWAAAIHWEDAYKFHNGATTSAKNLQFDFSDPDEGYYMYEESPMNGIGENSVTMRDLDGSLTGSAGVTVVEKGVYFTKNSNCQEMSGWNLEICDEYFAKFYIWPMEDESFSTFITDAAGEVESFQKVNNLRIGYTASAGETYLLNWNGKMPSTINVRMGGLEVNDYVIVGVCLPAGAVASAAGELDKIFEIEGAAALVEAADLAALSSTAEANIFIDAARDIVYRKFVEDRPRGANDLADCIGGILDYDHCPSMKVKMQRWADTLDFTDGDCRAR